MTEKITWFEEVLRLEPNSKLFFPLAQAYLREQRPGRAVAVLRKGLTFHPEHLEARLLLIECLSPGHTDARETATVAGEPPEVGFSPAPELESLTAVLAGHPSFWRQWAAQSRADGRNDLALTLDMLAAQLGGVRITWGTLLEQGLRTITGQCDKSLARAHQMEQPPSPPALEPALNPAPAPGLAPEPEGDSAPKSQTPAPEAAMHSTGEPSRATESLDASSPENAETLEEGTPDISGKPLGDTAEDVFNSTVERDPGSEPETFPESASEELSEAIPDTVSGTVSGDIREDTSQAPSEDVSDTVPAGDLKGESEGDLEAAADNPPDAPGQAGPEALREDAGPGPESASDPEAEGDWELSEGERRYYETKTYADLLARQGEQEEALFLYAKLLQTAPDEEKRLDLETRIRELRDLLAKGSKEPTSMHIGPKGREPLQELEREPEERPGVVDESDSRHETNPEPEPASAPRLTSTKEKAAPETDASSGSTTSPASKPGTRKTLKKLAHRLESRAGK